MGELLTSKIFLVGKKNYSLIILEQFVIFYYESKFLEVRYKLKFFYKKSRFDFVIIWKQLWG